MNTKVLLSTIAISTCLSVGIGVKAQTISAPTGQSITVTNPIDVTVAGGSVNVPLDGSIKFGGSKMFSTSASGQDLFIGIASGGTVSTGTGNSYIGAYSGENNTTGYQNLGFGTRAGRGNTSGYYNLFIGTDAGYGNTGGFYNTFIGTASGYYNGNGNNNVFIAPGAGGPSTGSNNNYIGVNAGQNNTTGSYNAGFGFQAGKTNTTGTYNTLIGDYSDVSSANLTNATAIGSYAIASASNTVVLGNAATTITGQGLASGNSGLRFANLNSTSAATAIGGSKVLTVDASGNVILATLSSGTLNSVGSNGPVVESTWKNQDGYLYNNSTNGVVINGSGLEGNALIVKGGVLSKEVNVKIDGSDSWPDYVFKPNYKRMTLEEVERFININGHLPNVPSATEMAQTGNNLGKTDIKLLEKVEELTLYLLEMKKANDAQSAEIQSLKNQMSKLKKSRK
jgi:trimeric autotransporter adhesin